VTDAHVFEDDGGYDLDFASLGIPLDPSGPIEVRTLANATMYRSHAQLDLGITALPDDLANELERSWRFLGL
jgi:hypothetical protein